jgi:hypothetical protein
MNLATPSSKNQLFFSQFGKNFFLQRGICHKIFPSQKTVFWQFFVPPPKKKKLISSLQISLQTFQKTSMCLSKKYELIFQIFFKFSVPVLVLSKDSLHSLILVLVPLEKNVGWDLGHKNLNPNFSILNPRTC